MTYLCERCAQVFQERAEYTDHKKAHMRGEIPDKSVDELIGKEAEPTEVTEPIIAEPIFESRAADALGKAGKTATGKKIEKEARLYDKPQPLNLVYHYQGQCHICSGEVETLTLDDVIQKDDKHIKSKQVVVAWCPSCKKQLRQRQVAKL